jgi:hypothetical protein
LAKQGITELNHPHIRLIYPTRLYFIPQNQIQAEDTEDIKRNVTKELLALHANEFKKCFQHKLF